MTTSYKFHLQNLSLGVVFNRSDYPKLIREYEELVRANVQISYHGRIMSYHDTWLLTPLERDIIISELNNIADKRSGKDSGGGTPDVVKKAIEKENAENMGES